ncbi:hypothetical protein [Terasakiella sp. SH-1]|uniref:hypothetical protein n=1 Tax=Terasakiella sp. SH-1 TaxID=2560057 RepID=UPI001073C163|nr:hypothetical protein [Terasakiella sp. SH-1]
MSVQIDDALKEEIKRAVWEYLQEHDEVLPANLVKEVPETDGIFPFEQQVGSNRLIWLMSLEGIYAIEELVEEGKVSIDADPNLILTFQQMISRPLAGKQKKYAKPRFVKAIFRRVKSDCNAPSGQKGA